MDILDRILGLKSEHQEQVDTVVSIIEENERLQAENQKLAEQLATERQKVHNIEKLIEASMAAIKEMK
jgi:regulator of replication initiation timing